VLTGVNISAYYYTFMVLLVIAYRGRAEQLMLLFCVEFLVYAFQLFDDHEVLMLLYKSALLLGVFAALFGREVWAAVAAGRRAPQALCRLRARSRKRSRCGRRSPAERHGKPIRRRVAMLLASTACARATQ